MNVLIDVTGQSSLTPLSPAFAIRQSQLY